MDIIANQPGGLGAVVGCRRAARGVLGAGGLRLGGAARRLGAVPAARVAEGPVGPIARRGLGDLVTAALVPPLHVSPVDPAVPHDDDHHDGEPSADHSVHCALGPRARVQRLWLRLRLRHRQHSRTGKRTSNRQTAEQWPRRRAGQRHGDSCNGRPGRSSLCAPGVIAGRETILNESACHRHATTSFQTRAVHALARASGRLASTQRACCRGRC
jgi:hypothetical protein